MKLKMLFFSSKIGNVKNGTPLRRGLASPRIDATLKVDSTPHPMRNRAALRILESRCQNDTKTGLLLTLEKNDKRRKRGEKAAFSEINLSNI
jgi:hypothetical protein